MIYLLKLGSAKNKNKRFRAFFSDGDYKEFGSKNGFTFIDGASEETKRNYIKRHKVNENWRDFKSAGALSRYILWGASNDININVKFYNDIIKNFSK